MATPKDKYYEKLLETLANYNNHNGAPFFNDNIRHIVSKITMDTLFQSPIQKKDISTINDSGYIESNDQVDTIRDSNKHNDPSSNPRADTHITNRIQILPIRPITF